MKIRTGIPSFLEVHPAQTMNSTQMNAIKATAIPVWCPVKNEEQHYTMIPHVVICAGNGHCT
jgi:hypothetical protein